MPCRSALLQSQHQISLQLESNKVEREIDVLVIALYTGAP